MPYKSHHSNNLELKLQIYTNAAGDDTQPTTITEHAEAHHRPSILSRIAQHIFRDPATQCMEHSPRDDPRGWGGGVRGIVRRKGCKHRDHRALAFHRDIDTSMLPDRIKGFRTRPLDCNRPTSTDVVLSRFRPDPYGDEFPREINRITYPISPPVTNYYHPHVRVSNWGGYWCDGDRPYRPLTNEGWEVGGGRGASGNFRIQGDGNGEEGGGYLRMSLQW
ncbi:hypothetical protein F4859DRAFT_494276 [Xylaria cf. heliscus]|nr:hypothetical protein F4859DRAFT_494276 [Xylaria cf. heliscus]